ncbi:hypothetical protein [Pseudomonas sp. 37 R 15]|nr:hypothetical protein [Pseudomonas sp. 37 R 15]
MLATGHAFDSGGDGLVARVHIIRRNNRNTGARLVYTDSDALAVIQRHGQRIGDVGHWRAVLIHKAGGVNDVAAFANGGSGGQDYINFVDGVIDRGGRTVASNFQLLKVAASRFSDLDGLSALVDEHVIAWRRDGHSADGVAGFNDDRRTVVQFQSDVSTSLVAQGRGIGDLTTFVNSIWRGQRDGSGVVGARSISNGGINRRGTRHQILEVLATRDGLNSSGDGLITLVRIIRRNKRNATARLIHTDSDALAVIERDGQRIGEVSHRRAVFIHKAGGVNDGAAFANGGGSGQDYVDFVDGVVDCGGRTVTRNFQFFEVTTSGFGDLNGLRALVDKHIIGRRRHGHSADGVTSFDGDRRAVIEFQRDVSTGLVAQGRGVGNLTTFIHLGRSCQGNGGGVVGAWSISHGGVNWRGARHQIFEVLATGHAIDRGGDGLVAFVHIIRRNKRNATARLIHTDSDALAVIERDGQRIGEVSHRRTVLIYKAGGVNDVAAFTNGRSGGQDYINFVDGVIDRSGRAVACNFQLLEVAASGLSDLDSLRALVDKHIIGRRWHGHGADSIASFDGDR